MIENNNDLTKKMVEKIISENYEFEEYKKYIIQETPEDLKQLTEMVMDSYDQVKNIEEKIKSIDNNSEKETLKKELLNQKKIYDSCIKIFSDLILKHQGDSKYIENIINQMPFLKRAAFIDSTVMGMLSNSRYAYSEGYIEKTNALDVFERSIDKEIRERLKTMSFEDLCNELYVNAEFIAHPLGIRSSVEKYDCINFTLYRLDKELGKNFFNNPLSTVFGDKDVYEFDRNIYEEHEPENIKEIFGDKVDRRREWVKKIYWAQKLTDEDKERLGLNDFPDLLVDNFDKDKEGKVQSVLDKQKQIKQQEAQIAELKRTRDK